MHFLPTTLLLAAASLSNLQPPAPAAPSALRPVDGFARISPFTEVLVDDGTIHVMFEGAPHELVALQGIPAADLWRHCQATFGSRAEKRLAEDLVEVLAGFGMQGVRRVDLELRSAEGALVRRQGVEMTEANRQSVWTARNRGTGVLASALRGATKRVPRIAREHAATPAPAFAWLAEPRPAWGPSAPLPLEAALEDLDELEWWLTHEYSYRDLPTVASGAPFDFPAALDAVRLGLAASSAGTGTVQADALATRVAEVMAHFGDGHSMPRGLVGHRAAGYLPLLVADAKGGAVAFHPDRSGPLDPAHPFIVAIDGEPLAAWLARAGRMVPHGSAALRRNQGLRALRYLNALRVEGGLAMSPDFTVTLANADGATVEHSGRLAERVPTFGTWPRPTAAQPDAGTTRWLAGEVGYLRIASMASGTEAELHAQLEAFSVARGLVIDVRGNGGGSRDILRLMLPRFLDPQGGPRVVNVGARRLAPAQLAAEAREGQELLANRSLFRADAAHWSAPERAAIAALDFTPDWKVPADNFSPWHFMVVAPDAERHFAGPVVVLLDGGCFSATDIFLGAFADATDATLIGTPSGGGSGRTQRVQLANSGLELRLSTMASFRADGTRYDHKGVAPDIVVEPAPSDLTTTDSTLEFAHAWLLEQLAE